MNIVIFGTGRFYRNRKEKIKEIYPDVNIIAFLDNNSKLWGTEIEGIPVLAPENINTVEYDKIVLMSIWELEMEKQLLKLGVNREKIVSGDKYLKNGQKGEMHIYYDIFGNKENKEKILLISVDLEYNGGTTAIINAGIALRKSGYNVILATSGGNISLIKEITKKGITVVVYPNLMYAKKEELFWTTSYSKIVLNTLQMIHCANELGKNREVWLWLHESKNMYQKYVSKFPSITLKNLNKVQICAVSEIAKDNFMDYYGQASISIIPYGIADISRKNKVKKKEKMVFAIIGSICYIKAHDIFLQAIEKLNKEETQQVEFWIVGKGHEGDKFYQEILQKVEGNNKVYLKGEFNQKEMNELYEEIDVVVNPSRCDCLPTVVVEGMRDAKVCITSNVTGIAKYIEDGKNGFICKMEDADDLFKKIRWILKNDVSCKKIGEEARKIYEQNFTIEAFADRIKQIF